MTSFNNARLSLLRELNAGKLPSERNKLGQYATPDHIATEMANFALNHVQERQIRFLEPGLGTATFFSAIRELAGSRLSTAVGYEVDPHFSIPISALAGESGLNVILEDFLLATPQPFDVILCNPPYIRHHHFSAEKKSVLAGFIKKKFGITISKLAGLYNYFIMAGESWLSDDGIAGWLVPSEFLDVNYGVAVKQFLKERVDLIGIHLFDQQDSQFSDALVSSAIIWYKKKGSETNEANVKITTGGSILLPDQILQVPLAELDVSTKWTRLIRRLSTEHIPVSKSASTLSDYFTIRRGIATGDNAFFILTKARAQELEIPFSFLRPILPSPRHLDVLTVTSDESGVPDNVEQLFLVDCREPLDHIKLSSQALSNYLDSGAESTGQKYLCRNRRMWYLQERRDPAPFLCTYMGRSSEKNKQPFQFILNKSSAIATNSFLLLYPKSFLQSEITRNPAILERIWERLNSLTVTEMTDEGRTYGGGLEKIEPRELGKVRVPELEDLIRPLETQIEIF